jgi:hypothetical protein
MPDAFQLTKSSVYQPMQPKLGSYLELSLFSNSTVDIMNSNDGPFGSVTKFGSLRPSTRKPCLSDARLGQARSPRGSRHPPPSLPRGWARLRPKFIVAAERLLLPGKDPSTLLRRRSSRIVLHWEGVELCRTKNTK